MDGTSLLLPTRSVEDIDWSPGILKSESTSQIPKETRKQDCDLEIARWKKYAETDWQRQWYGVPYPRTKLMWEDLAKEEKASTFRDSFWYPEPINEVYTLHYLERFYRQLDAIQRNPSWTGYEMANAAVMLPSLCQNAPPGMTNMRRATPAVGGMSFDEWIQYCADPVHHLVPAGTIRSTPNVESEDEVTGDFVEDSVWLVPQNSSPTSRRDDSGNSADGSRDESGSESENGGLQVPPGGVQDITMNEESEGAETDVIAPRRRRRAKMLEMPPAHLGSWSFPLIASYLT